jgi:hypothetical protein
VAAPVLSELPWVLRLLRWKPFENQQFMVSITEVDLFVSQLEAIIGKGIIASLSE